MNCLKGGGLSLVVDDRTLTMYDATGAERLLVLPSLGICVPELYGKATDVRLVSLEELDGCLILTSEGSGWRSTVTVRATDGALTLAGEFTALSDCLLSRVSILPAKTGINLYDVVNFRNRHYTSQTWPEQLLGGKGCVTDTYSGDWQFAPHPSILLLRKNELTLCLGSLDLSTSYGLYFAASNFFVDHLYLDYGGEHGQSLAAGQTFKSPEIFFFLRSGEDPYQVTARYTRLLIESGRIPNPEAKERHAWHRGNLYCSWMDQGYVAGEYVADELGVQQLSQGTPVQAACTESFVQDILEKIEQKKLPFTTFLIDDGWQVSRGQWEAELTRFPNLRGTIDEIHRRGMKSLVWWNWAEIFDDADVDPSHLVAGGWRNKHGHRVRDYSNPKTQTEYLAPLFRTLLSSEPGCYNFDGIKTDFLADKVHPDMPIFDPEWRGEENYCYRLLKLCHELMRQFKADGCHMGCAGHPYLAEYIDINRTYDVATSNVFEHANRAKMLMASTPGCPVSFDLHNYLERFDEYFAVARQTGASVQIGNILGMKRDRFTEWEPASAEFDDVMRKGLCMHQELFP